MGKLEGSPGNDHKGLSSLMEELERDKWPYHNNDRSMHYKKKILESQEKDRGCLALLFKQQFSIFEQQ